MKLQVPQKLLQYRYTAYLLLKSLTPANFSFISLAQTRVIVGGTAGIFLTAVASSGLSQPFPQNSLKLYYFKSANSFNVS